MKTTHDVVVIGAGAGGLNAAAISVIFGARTLMIDRELPGGDCTWTGCIPSKTLLHAASTAHVARNAGDLGIAAEVTGIDSAKVMDHVRAVRRKVYEEADTPERFEAMGVEFARGSATFLNDREVEIEGPGGDRRVVSGRIIVIATGGRPLMPSIPGLADADPLTNHSLFELERLPSSMTVIGGGPIGVEMSQALQRLGTSVSLVEMADGILPRDDRELAGQLADVLRAEGVRIEPGARVTLVEGSTVTFERYDATTSIDTDRILVAAGRRPNIESLNLAAAGVEFDSGGVTINDRCRTSRRHIYAVGDVTGQYQFTHMSEHMAKTAMTNALLLVPAKLDRRHVPWVTYTSPELAQVGASEVDLIESGRSFETHRFPFSKIDRAITENAEVGLVKVFATKWGRILGASILGARAGDMVCEIAVAMKHGVSLRKLSETIHPYPTYNLGVRRAADQWLVRRQSMPLFNLFKRFRRFRGEVYEFPEGKPI